VEWELFAFLPLSSPSTSRGMVVALPGVVELPRVVVVGRAVEAKGREGRDDTPLVGVCSSRRLWATLMEASSSGAVSSTSISVSDPWKAGAEARKEKGVGWCWAAFDEAGGRLEAGAAGAGGAGRGWVEEDGLLEKRGGSSLSSSEVGVGRSKTAASPFVPLFV
jgi:hypothetical protein